MKRTNSDDFSCSFKVKYLNPIVLTCLLPKSYPSHLPPYYTISIQWLDAARISRLCSVLDTIWTEQAGQEVVYQWVECLQTSSLVYLEIDKEITLGPYNKGHLGDIRAVSGSVSPEVDVPAIVNYDNQRREEDFCMNLQECCICLSQFAGKLNNWLMIRCYYSIYSLLTRSTFYFCLYALARIVLITITYDIVIKFKHLIFGHGVG